LILQFDNNKVIQRTFLKYIEEGLWQSSFSLTVATFFPLKNRVMLFPSSIHHTFFPKLVLSRTSTVSVIIT